MKKTPSDMFSGATFDTNNYGMVEVVEYFSSKRVDVKFVDTGFTTSVESGQLRSGRVKDKLKPTIFGVAFLGDNDYPSCPKGVPTQEYRTWFNMLDRCYNPERSDRNKCYENATVCDEWHNYGNFYEWFQEQYFEKGMHLDKDIKGDGSLVYSPENCCFVTPAENNIKAHAKNFKALSPSGEVFEFYNLREFCRLNSLESSSLSMVMSGKRKHHKGWRKAT